MRLREKFRVLAGAVFSAFCDGLYMSMPVTFTDGHSP
jgi:hypothetical protein